MYTNKTYKSVILIDPISIIEIRGIRILLEIVPEGIEITPLSEGSDIVAPEGAEVTIVS